MALTKLEEAMLDFELRWQDHRGSKEDAIVTAFNLTAARYYQLLAPLLERPDALDYAPELVNRLRRPKDDEDADQTTTLRSRFEIL